MDQQLPKIKKEDVPGEAQIGDKEIKQFAPDLINQGPKLAMDLGVIHKVKPLVDKVFNQIALVTHSNVSSRVKDPKQIVRKIVQKRMEDRSYQQSDINDALGYRFTYISDIQKQHIESALEQANKQNKFIILKQEDRNKADYHATHFDCLFPIGQGKSIRIEVQVLSTKDAAQASLDHDNHFIHGEQIPKSKQKEVKKQMSSVSQMPPIKQKMVESTMIAAHKQNGDGVLPQGFGNKVVDAVKRS
jgi:ppGpp synthetase/RelA/SpoT-type nucleotidyltranferase